MKKLRRWIRRRRARNPRRSADYRSWAARGVVPVGDPTSVVAVLERRIENERALFRRRPVYADWQREEWA